ncbi:MAG: tyrosine-type recombinase/integrase, partial [Propionibacteriaceae bacterium]|nr:tyrosine-type recombinase/integrase [Propionibacteriaceae bacterium]
LNLDRFNQWCEARSIDDITEITIETLNAYRQHLFHYRNPDTNKPLKFSTQSCYLVVIRRWFLWLHEKGIIPNDVAKDLELPKPEERLPVDVLTAEEVESTMNQTDATQPLGIRDRAILETFYSTGIRASELAHLQLYDLDADRKILIIRQGKGKKDRVVPIGDRAIRWLQKYMTDVRPTLMEQSEPHPTLFVTRDGVPIQRSLLALIVKRYMRKAGIKKPGSCHLLRHTAATLMMENGADLRSLQLFLGHACLKTTQLYTHVSIQRLQEVHRNTHPASIPPPKEDEPLEQNDPN